MTSFNTSLRPPKKSFWERLGKSFIKRRLELANLLISSLQYKIVSAEREKAENFTPEKFLTYTPTTDFFIGYQPDSFSYFKCHSEFDSLFKTFISRNEINNGGDTARLWCFMLNIKQILAENIEGDFAELGVWRGNTASVLAHYAAEVGRELYLFDTFEGFDSRDFDTVDSSKQSILSDTALRFADTSLEIAKNTIGSNCTQCHFIQGYFPDSIQAEHKNKQYAIVSLDCDLYEPMKAGLEFFYPLMPPGGLLLLHDYSSLHWPGAKIAVDEFCMQHQENVVLMPDKSGSAIIRKRKNQP